MSCAPFQELLSAALDGELNSAEQAQLDQHLADCSACRSLQERLRRLETGFAHLPEASPPPLRSRATIAPAPAKQGSAAGAAAIWSAVLAAAASAAVLFWNPTGPAPRGSELYFSSHQLLQQHPPEQRLAVSEFRSPPLHGKVLDHGQLAFEIHLDSHQRACKDLQLEVQYDFDGDGQVDRSEVYEAFDTDDKEGWEVYTRRHGPVSQQGEMKDFVGGTLACRLKNASGYLQLRQGNSRLVLPYHLGV
ncbi:MAG: zf-HC2 domain-containing protein [Candidatus Eremiobacteraeota bacterium]|nr:zf-HC2 domain-containing protein [Candidatus Eremiobacteraeota bacterium]MCW5866343.1 zf-HC2 domain-containing protein [Candidatus Eremiobacteraeota bacterium]